MVQIYSVDHIDAANTTETMECPFETEEVVCEFVFGAQHIDRGNWWVDPHICILLFVHG